MVDKICQAVNRFYERRADAATSSPAGENTAGMVVEGERVASEAEAAAEDTEAASEDAEVCDGGGGCGGKCAGDCGGRRSSGLDRGWRIRRCRNIAEDKAKLDEEPKP